MVDARLELEKRNSDVKEIEVLKNRNIGCKKRCFILKLTQFSTTPVAIFLIQPILYDCALAKDNLSSRIASRQFEL